LRWQARTKEGSMKIKTEQGRYDWEFWARPSVDRKGLVHFSRSDRVLRRILITYSYGVAIGEALQTDSILKRGRRKSTV
jgi:hypothetical protein